MANSDPGLKACVRSEIDVSVDRWYDMIWMWTRPSDESRQDVKAGEASSEEKIRSTIADGGDQETLIQDLSKAAASFRPKGVEKHARHVYNSR